RLVALGATDRADVPPGPTRGPRARTASRPVARLADDSIPLPGSHGPGVPPGCLDGTLGRRRGIPGRVLGAAALGVGVVAAGLFSLGEQPTVTPEAHRAAALTLLAQAPGASSTEGVVPISSGAGGQQPGSLDAVDSVDGVLAWMREHGWTCPVGLPEGYQVTDLRVEEDGARELELDLRGSRGTVVLTQQHGLLDAAALAGTRVVEVEGREVHVLSTSPWHGVWQSGDTVISVVAEVPEADVNLLIAAHPDRTYDSGVPARISRGWRTVAGAWNP
ncbi:hypothetical protein, partial [Actinotalea sp. C106]|uniref:hypothetical protein n=1 Tax=Actinotalea sp. C106 TaxID=2908644 RepID=UPI0020290F40